MFVKDFEQRRWHCIPLNAYHHSNGKYCLHVQITIHVDITINSIVLYFYIRSVAPWSWLWTPLSQPRANLPHCSPYLEGSSYFIGWCPIAKQTTDSWIVPPASVPLKVNVRSAMCHHPIYNIISMHSYGVFRWSCSMLEHLQSPWKHILLEWTR